MNKITLDFNCSRGTIAPELYGHFTEHIGGVFYDGLWVGEESKVENIHGFRKAMVDSLKRIAPPVLRWPGGCFAETYDWRDGIGPRASRPRRINWWYYCDGRVESNHVGTHEFMRLCRLTGAQPYVAANMTSISPMHVRDWIEYCNLPAGVTSLADERAQNGDEAPFNVRYWGIGNENWGGGGQMTPERCADEFIRFTTVCRPLTPLNLRFIMCGANGHDLDWTRRMLRQWSGRPWHETPAWGMSVHYYTNALSGKDDVNFDEAGWYDELFRADYMRRIVDDHRAVMDQYDPERKLKIVVDEWGNWHIDGTGPSKGSNLFEQQSNMRDAQVAAITLNFFNNRCDVVGMTNVAQLCNNLHSLYLASGEHMVETPNYHVFHMFQGHKGGRHIEAKVEGRVLESGKYEPLELLSASASVKNGVLTLTMANLDLTSAADICLFGHNGSIAGEGSLRILYHREPMTCNTFDNPYAIHPTEQKIALSEGSRITLPAASIAVLTVALLDGRAE